MGRLLAAAVVSAFVLSLAASALMGTNVNDTTVLNLAFVTSDTGEFVCNGKHLKSGGMEGGKEAWVPPQMQTFNR